jgi:methylmalonyl-CoA/ethylmalonyl-CoA epimerase
MATMQLQDSEMSVLAKYVRSVDHIGIAVPDLEASIQWYTSVLGLVLKERRSTEGTRSGMISAVLEAGPLEIVLLQGTSTTSQVTRYLEHYGPGVQHIALRVEHIEDLISDLDGLGFSFDTTLIEGGGLRQIFSKRHDGSGLMIEFIERTSTGFVDTNIASLFSQLETKDSF